MSVVRIHPPPPILPGVVDGVGLPRFPDLFRASSRWDVKRRAGIARGRPRIPTFGWWTSRSHRVGRNSAKRPPRGPPAHLGGGTRDCALHFSLLPIASRKPSCWRSRPPNDPPPGCVAAHFDDAFPRSPVSRIVSGSDWKRRSAGGANEWWPPFGGTRSFTHHFS